jgi:hypothetical protein
MTGRNIYLLVRTVIISGYTTYSTYNSYITYITYITHLINFSQYIFNFMIIILSTKFFFVEFVKCQQRDLGIACVFEYIESVKDSVLIYTKYSECLPFG